MRIERVLANILLIISVAVILILSQAVVINAAQSESAVACDESAEPIHLNYGDYTTGCEINPQTDLDRFSFDGVAGDMIRISVQSLSGNVDPHLEIWDPDMNKIEDTYCINTPCSYSVDVTLPATGTYFIAMSDISTNQSGDYIFEVNRILPVPDPLAVDIEYGTAVRDTIDPQTDMDFFKFQGEADSLIRISVQSLSGNVDPRLELWDPDMNKIEDTYCINTPCSYSVDVTLPATGTYFIAMSDISTNQSGDYIFEVNRILPVPDPLAVDIEYGTAVRDTIDPQTDMDFFKFEGEADSLIRISVQSLSGNVDPRLEIWDPDMIKIEDTYCINTPCSYSVDVTLPATGTYFIAMSDISTNQSGDYIFEVNRISPVPDDTFVLAYGCSVNNTIDPQTDMDFYIFEGDASSLIRINVLSLSGNVDPRLEIWDPDMNKIEDTYCINTPCSYSVDVTLPLTGTYLLSMSDISTNQSGNYQIGLECLFGNCPVIIEDSDCDGIADGDDNCYLTQNLGQEDTDGDGYGNMCDADLDNDGVVGFNDYNIFGNAWGSGPGDVKWNPDADFDSDGVVGFNDYNIFGIRWGTSAPWE